MIVQYISDLHLEFQIKLIKEFKISEEADVLIFAGDISNSPKDIDKLFKSLRKRTNIPIIYVLGNHEYYGYSTEIIEKYKEVSNNNQVHLLENDWVVINNIIFAGTTLYSNLSNPIDALAVKEGMNDFHVVKLPEGGNLTTEYWNNKFLAAKSFLKIILKESTKPVVIITHFAPLLQLGKHPYRNTTSLSSGFASNLSNLFFEYKIKAWIYGHTHNPIDIKLNECNIISNQVGYPHESWLNQSIALIEI